MDFAARVVDPGELGPCASCGKDGAFKLRQRDTEQQYCYTCATQVAQATSRLVDGKAGHITFEIHGSSINASGEIFDAYTSVLAIGKANAS